MKTAGINELRALVAEALPNAAAAQKLTEAIVRATELARDEDSTAAATKADLAELRTEFKTEIRDLRAEMHQLFRDQTWRLTTSVVVVVLVATVLQHFWR
jgi:hypothetical protein